MEFKFVNLRSVMLCFLCLSCFGCTLNQTKVLPLLDNQKALVALGYKHDCWTLKITKENSDVKTTSLAYAVIFLESFFGSDRLDFINKPLKEVNKTSLDILFLENQDKQLNIEVNYAERGTEIDSRQLITAIYFDEVFQVDVFYLLVDSGFIFEIFVNREKALSLHTKMKSFEQIYNSYQGGFVINQYL